MLPGLYVCMPGKSSPMITNHLAGHITAIPARLSVGA